ncbi:heme exporter protein D [Polynucleobacter kasalickyi]|uniref:Heme exporter protein D n=2 Tax=Polynucleobacter kasalickyi TaxID=1938817 RepID=A0A1W1Y444_9BURK|nr:heme exporter protein D [Polynucleobacter kasalickyi]
MIWESFSEFIHMRGYGLYVWGSFGVTALCIAWEVFQLRKKKQELFLGQDQ